MRNRILSCTFLMMCSALLSDVAIAARKLPAEPTAAEFARLPPYCKARMGGDAASRQHWQNQLGSEIFLHVHHFCMGMNEMSRARTASDNQERAYSLRGAINNFDYVLARWPASHPMTLQARRLKSQAELMRPPK